jgi:ATP-dependent DNA helicase PIF1
MDEDQQRAVDLALSGKSFFLTGAGGTGKSYTIRSIIDALNKDNRDVALTAMTGCAALLLGRGAKTLHSWAGIGLGKEPVDVILQKLRKSFKAKKGWQSADTLIIDEVSMMTPDLFDKLDQIGRAILRVDKPFGGIQVIAVGDMYQLPPVNKENTGSFFVFESQTWKQLMQDAVVLRYIHRQSDPVFLKILEEARAGNLSKETIKILESRRTNEWKKLEIKPTLLFTKRADVDQINITQLQKCEGEDKTFRARTNKTQKYLIGHSIDQVTEYAIDKMDKSGAYVPELTLRKGAQVMLLTNKFMEHGLVNGSRGIIESFSEGLANYPYVKFINGETLLIDPHTWVSEDVDGLERQQIPLRLAYAVTIHKAQGATLDCALIDIGKNTFEYGQAYVALSRVKSLDCLYIWDLDPSAFRVHPKVDEFLQHVYELDTTVRVQDPSVETQADLTTSAQSIPISLPSTEERALSSDDPS